MVPGAAGTTVAIPRLGIPTTVQCDGPAGVHIDAHREGDSRSYFATGFPIGTCLASTWNTFMRIAQRVNAAAPLDTTDR